MNQSESATHAGSCTF